MPQRARIHPMADLRYPVGPFVTPASFSAADRAAKLKAVDDKLEALAKLAK